MKFDLFFRTRRLTILLVILVCVAGASAFNSLPRQEDPELTRRWARVLTFFPGADALRVEALVTEKIEKELQEIAEIKRISSRSQTGLSIISLQLEDDITAVDDVWSEVRSKLNDARNLLPAQAGEPDFEVNTTAASTLLVGFKWEQDDAPQIDIMYRLVQELEDTLIALPGTKETDIYGEPQEEILVSLEPAGLAAVDVSIREIANLVANADPKVSAGRLQGDQTSLILELSGALDTVERIRQIPLRHNENGFVLRIGDVARVDRLARQPPDTITLVDGRRGIILGAKMEENRRVDRWTREAKRKIERFSETLPPGISVGILFEQSIHTDVRLVSLAENLLLGAALVMVVLFVMMGWRSAVLVGTALPLTLLLVLTFFNVLDVPLHQISITGLIIALGLLIDNAIVSVDEFNQFRQAGKSPSEAISATVGHLFVPLVASTATTMLTFLPLVIMPGNAGEFVSTLGIGVILSIWCSLFLSLSVVPAFAGWIEARWPTRAGPGGFWRNGLNVEWMARLYRRVVTLTLRHPFLGIALSISLPIAGFGLSTQLINQFFPPVNRNQFQLQLKLPSLTSIAETRRLAEQARAMLHAHPEVLRSHWFIGEKPPRVFYNVTITEDGSPRFASAFVDTRSPADTRELLPRLQVEMMEAFPEAMILTLPFEQGPPVESPIGVRLYGPDVGTLAALGEDLRRVLSRTLKVTFAEATIARGQPKLLVRPDEEEARIAGFSLTDIASQLDGALEGVTGGTILEGTEEIPVRVRIASTERTALDRIAANSLTPPGSRTAGDRNPVPGVPLTSIARIDLVPAVAAVTRRHGERVNTIRAYLEPFSLVGPSFKDFRKKLAASNFSLPPGYRLEYGGETEGSGEARANLMSVFAPLMVLMVSTLVLAFNSFRMAMIIGFVAVLAAGAGLASVWSFGYPLGFMAIIGCMGLIGIAINDSIVVLAAVRADEKARQGDVDATVDVVMAASRHVISTTFTTIGGFTPLIIWGGIFWPPLAVAVAGGMIGATILALFFVPPVHRLFARGTERRRIRRAARAAAAAVPAAGAE